MFIPTNEAPDTQGAQTLLSLPPPLFLRRDPPPLVPSTGRVTPTLVSPCPSCPFGKGMTATAAHQHHEHPSASPGCPSALALGSQVAVDDKTPNTCLPPRLLRPPAEKKTVLSGGYKGNRKSTIETKSSGAMAWRVTSLCLSFLLQKPRRGLGGGKAAADKAESTIFFHPISSYFLM